MTPGSQQHMPWPFVHNPYSFPAPTYIGSLSTEHLNIHTPAFEQNTHRCPLIKTGTGALHDFHARANKEFSAVPDPRLCRLATQLMCSNISLLPEMAFQSPSMSQPPHFTPKPKPSLDFRSWEDAHHNGDDGDNDEDQEMLSGLSAVSSLASAAAAAVGGGGGPSPFCSNHANNPPPSIAPPTLALLLCDLALDVGCHSALDSIPSLARSPFEAGLHPINNSLASTRASCKPQHAGFPRTAYATGYVSPCGHTRKSRRLRIKKGIDHMICTVCWQKWRKPHEP